jgi:hypothetical protein
MSIQLADKFVIHFLPVSQPRTRPASNCIRQNIESAPFGDLQYTANDTGDALPVLRFKGQLFQPAPSDGVNLRFAVVLGSAPLPADAAVQSQPLARKCKQCLR